MVMSSIEILFTVSAAVIGLAVAKAKQYNAGRIQQAGPSYRLHSSAAADCIAIKYSSAKYLQ
jgi:hypothetical protein